MGGCRCTHCTPWLRILVVRITLTVYYLLYYWAQDLLVWKCPLLWMTESDRPTLQSHAYARNNARLWRDQLPASGCTVQWAGQGTGYCPVWRPEGHADRGVRQVQLNNVISASRRPIPDQRVGCRIIVVRSGHCRLGCCVFHHCLLMLRSCLQICVSQRYHGRLVLSIIHRNLILESWFQMCSCM